MGLKLASTLAITALFALMYALVFIIGVWFLPSGLIGLAIMIGFVLLIVFFQYLISPVIIKWVYRIDWMTYDEYGKRYPHLADVLDKVIQVQGIKPPRLGIIHDRGPNAFCFGYTKNKARIVISEGIFEFLNEDEQSAVMAHELGHVVHSDFILMTVVFAIPLVLLTISRWAYYTALFSGRRSKNDDADSLYLALYAVALLAYIGYIVGYMISLIVSRVREYYADQHAADVMENPNFLATGLVKIAYGLLADTSVSIEERNKSKMRGLRGLGIFNPSGARGLALSSSNASGAYSKNAIQAAAAWDLYNPWARYYEILSTHPLPAKRIKALNKQCEAHGKTPEIDFSNAKKIKEEQAGKSMMDEFLWDVTIKNLARIIFIIMGVFSIFWLLGFTGFLGFNVLNTLISLKSLAILWAITFYLMGFAYIIRTGFMYKKNFEPKTILELVTNVKVSPIRCVPAWIEGEIIGKGNAGYWLSDDLYFKDETGIMYVDYRYGLSIVDFFWAITKVKKVIGQRARIRGWYRRGPIPFFQVDRIEMESGKVYKNHKKSFTYFSAVLAFILGALLFIIGFFYL